MFFPTRRRTSRGSLSSQQAKDDGGRLAVLTDHAAAEDTQP
jgi:hypothetical protein